MDKKKIMVLAVCLAFAALSAGCGKTAEEKAAEAPIVVQTSGAQTAAEKTSAAEQTAQETQNAQAVQTAQDEPAADGQQEGLLTFRDVYGTEHQMTVDPDAKPNPYKTGLFRKNGRVASYDDEAYICSLGVDVSAYQGDIDWQKVKEQGISFAFIRVGFRGYGEEGVLVEDEKGLENLAAAKAAGLECGVYFFSQAVSREEAAEEADYVIGLLQGQELQLPVVYDVEHIKDDTARTDDIDGMQFTQNAKAFCDRINASGYTGMIYSNLMWEAFEFDMGQLADYPFWYADYEDVPQTPYLFDFWQFDESGILDGIEGPVDLDLRIQPQ